MSNVVVLGFEDAAAADAFAEKLAKLHSDKALHLDDLVKVTVDADGAPKLHYIFSVTRGAALAGSILGGVVGLFVAAPVAGAAVGAAGGAALGKLGGDYGINDDFIREVSEVLKPGSAALFGLVDKGKPDEIEAELAGSQARVITTTLSPETEAALRTVLSYGDSEA
jgi:uncharacterized membrane protein